VVFCKHCGKELPGDGNIFCPNCGKSAKETTEAQTTTSAATTTTVPMGYHPYKSPGTAALIAIIGGIFGLPGIGHIYVGKIGKGIMILVSGIVLFFLGILSLMAGAALGPAGLAAGALLGIVLMIAYVAIWIWQIFNARTMAKQFNEHVKTYGKEPW
jgi:hypothetical protein